MFFSIAYLKGEEETHGSCLGRIFVSSLHFSVSAVEKRLFFVNAEFRKIISRKFHISYWNKKIGIEYFWVLNRKKMLNGKKMLVANFVWNAPYVSNLSNMMRVRKISWHKSSRVVVVCQKIWSYDQLDPTAARKSKLVKKHGMDRWTSRQKQCF